MQNVQMRRVVRCLLPLVALALAAPMLGAQATGFAAVKVILDRSCSGCHAWTSSYDTIGGGGHVVAKDPEKSTLWQKIADDSMPMAGDKLTKDEKSVIREWILAGAPAEAASAAPKAQAGTPIPSNAAAAKAPVSPALAAYRAKVIYHATTGFTSVAAFAAAGTIGVVHFIQMKEVVHAGGGFFGGGEGGGLGGDGTGDGSGQISSIWAAQQNGRYWHAGLVIAGEALYLGDAITGLSMLTKHTPGKITKSDIHRAAFFTHASLMVAQIALGFLETDAMSRGNHDAMLGYTAAHATIGVAIPAIMLFAGLENILP